MSGQTLRTFGSTPLHSLSREQCPLREQPDTKRPSPNGEPVAEFPEVVTLAHLEFEIVGSTHDPA